MVGVVSCIPSGAVVGSASVSLELTLITSSFLGSTLTLISFLTVGCKVNFGLGLVG